MGLLKEMVDSPMWFAEQSEVNEDFVRGYNQAVYQIRLMLTENNEDATGVRKYTEFMIHELNSYLSSMIPLPQQLKQEIEKL
jgi:hypothetical protein